MTASLGADDLDCFLDPQPRLLKQLSGIQPVPGGLDVRLESYGVRSTQRLALSRHGRDLVAALWPAELKPQAEYLYGRGLATPMIACARECGWTVEPSPHLAFRNSYPAQRLYMQPAIDAADYARRWEDGDLVRVGQYERQSIITTLWPWLKERGYADESAEGELEAFMTTQLGNRPAYLRPGLRFKRRWYADDADATATTIRDDVNAILVAAHEPQLPAAGPATEAESPEELAEDTSPLCEDVRAPLRRQAIPERVRHEVWRRDRGRCVDCGTRERLEFDHIVPVSRGGSNTARNIELRCESCNRRKSARI